MHDMSRSPGLYGQDINSALTPEPHIGASAADSPAPAEPHRAASEMVELDRSECLRLLAASNFGRLAVGMGDGPPVIRPVNYLFDDRLQSVVFRTALGSKFHALLKSTQAAFEIDGTDPTGRTGWSVIVVGVTEEITSHSDLDRLEGLGLDVWAPGYKGHWVGIRAWTVSGRRIVMAADAPPGHRA
jgi:uncharacterized protein